MNRLIVTSLAALVAVTSFAKKLTPEEIKEFNERAARSAERYEGGMVRKPNSAKGTFVVLNAQKKVARSVIEEAVKAIDKAIHPLTAIKDVDSVKVLNPKADIEKNGGAVGVALVESEDLPMLLVAPESGWAIVNVTELKKGAKDETVFASRVRKELMRAFALANGCSFMARGPIVLKSDVLTPRGLDEIKEEEYGVEAQMTLQRILPYHNVMPWREVTYRTACEEGWAASPTNKWQKKVWDSIYTMPDQPIKIKKK